ncbi:prolyl-tRNA synthetase [Candidatus Adlerbacteria bacterium RIFOXYC1_FULL_48_26]|uniref:Proline--tRNA ligase n=1 Tax=Candidatus Adlerbacteria bacterium RIFOXYC1_FULL_48_26 TaxID=1797247 RepID=A0A1F4Y5L5_9BACT|nr:MAG: prolyl-tRNA synthetase [Candidatus Adlerbacteria bacterium RIFOXYC1_FULL_48_26]OGC94306.1 MAG: prolyl-tRNA synthetase [Candidatus Adlerbacteria bacterium RIFOXYB1_FULL_48_10]
MKQSHLFTKTRREAPKDEVSKNAQLLIRAGYIHKEMAGVYDFLPLGLRTFEKVLNVIREEMNKIGGVELHLSALQNPETWAKTDRWSDENVDAWFKTKLKNGAELGLGFTHEEPLTALMTEQISSYKDLPVYAYQFQSKFRNEERAKSGLMRTREFVMKDLYSFSKDEAEHTKFYEQSSDAYGRVFERVGLGDTTFKTFASGGSFSKYSHEFQTVCDAGEDTIYIDDERKLALNKEVYDDPQVYEATGLVKENLREAKSVEVGNIFTLGTRFSEALGLSYKNEAGESVPVFMGSYGIGPARLMAVVAELLSDDKGLVWPESIAPFRVHLVELPSDNEEVSKEAAELYRELTEAGIEVLWDDREARAGEKFADSDLFGIPLRVVVSEKTLAAGKFECVERASGHTTHKSISELIGHLTA